MKNAHEFSSVSEQLKCTSERIGSLSWAIEGMEGREGDLAEVYMDLMVGQIEHAQILVLELTKLLDDTDELNADGGESVFAAGDLTNKKGEEPDGVGPANGTGA